MRVLYHIPVGFIGGAERQLQYLLKYLRRALSPNEFVPQVTYESDALTPFVASLGVNHALVSDRKSLFHVMDAFGPDIVQFYTSPLVYRTLNLLRTRPRVVEVIHNKNQFHGDATSYPKDRTDAVACVSPDARAFILQHFPSLRADVIPNGVDPEQFFPDPSKRSKTPVIGFAGRLCPDKGIGAIMEMAVQIPCQIELVGQDFGGYAGKCPKNVKVFPQTERPEEFYRRWWAFLSASPHESFGLAIAEAMACGTPPIMLDCGGITAYLKGPEACISFGAQELVQDVKLFLAGTMKLEPAAAELFSAKVMAQSYLELYRRLEAPQPATPAAAPAVPARAACARIFAPVEGRPSYPGGVLGVTPRSWYGVVRALAGVSDYYAPPEEALKAIDEHRPKLVVLGCFQEGWLEICRHARRRGAKVAATWHASYILNEFHDINRRWMAEMLDAYRGQSIDFLATPHAGLAENWTHYGFKTAWLPNIIGEAVPEAKRSSGIHIGILGSGQNWKNMECQIAAAGTVKGATIHVQEVQNFSVLERLGIKVKVHPKTLTDYEWFALLGGMTVNMCVSLSEVYSYLVAESFLMGVPVLTGSITPTAWLGQEIEERYTTPHFENPTIMAKKLEMIIDMHQKVPALGAVLTRAIKSLNAVYREQVAKVLEDWQ